ncbi:MAG: IPT/TIG domain-containing protein [Patescibacteria group bacterium]|nr:IPT/TIG domain-containing protein [Patescibacteria group bacterium]
MNKNWRKILLLIPIILLGMFVFANFVSAATLEIGLNYAGGTGLGSTDIRITIANVIRAFLGLLGIVAIAMILYGAVIFMTAQGVPEKIDKAKKILIAAVIGLVIILSAFAIASFIIGRILEATGPGGGGDGGGGGGGGGGTPPPTFGYCQDPDVASAGPYICRLAPAAGESGSFVTIYGGKFDSYDSNNSKVVFSKDGADTDAVIALCNGNPSWSDSTIVIEVPNLTDLGDYDLAVITSNGSSNDKPTGTSIAPNNRFTLQSGNPGPGIACMMPNEGNETTSVEVYGKRFGAAAGVLKFQNNVSAETSTWSDIHITSAVPAGAQSGEVFVYNSNNVKSDNGYNFTVTCGGNNDCSISKCCLGQSCVAAGYCAPNVGENCDTDAALAGCQAGGCTTGLFCDPNNNCTCQPRGVGSPCSLSATSCQADNTLCGSGLYCSASSCTCQNLPSITKVDPDNGAPGNYVTIFGSGFGNSEGQVFFASTRASLPTGCGAAQLWTDNQVVVEVPNEATSGKIRLVTADSHEALSPSDFTVNDTVRPSLCGVNPNSGKFGEAITLNGKNFGSSISDALIGGIDFNNKSGWTWADDLIGNLTVPNIQPATLSAQVKVGNNFSNSLNFSVLSTVGAPKIDYIDPTTGRVGQYITIFGSGFGVEAGTVYFQNNSAEPNYKNWAKADTNFPQECLAAGFWRDSSITVKVPSGTIESGKIVVEAKSGVSSNTADFSSCTNCALRPGICAVIPNQAPANTQNISILGDNFGDYNAPNSKILFWNNQASSDNLQSFWTNNKVSSVTVPANATTGPLQLVNSAGIKSNQVNFTVSDCRVNSGICTQGQICCQTDGICKTASECSGAAAQTCSYDFSFTTGRLPAGPPQVIEDFACETDTQSPSPWRNSTGNCKNAGIGARFNQPMIFSSLTSAFVIQDCTNAGGNYDTTKCGNQISAGSFTTTSGETESGFTFFPSSGWAVGHWYRVNLLSQYLKSEEGVNLDGDRDGLAGGDYGWFFQIDPNGVDCQPSSVLVTPAEPNPIILTSLNKAQEYQGSAMAAGCNLLNSNNFPWQWSVVSIADPFNSGVVSLSSTNTARTTASPLDQGQVYVKPKFIQTTLGIFTIAITNLMLIWASRRLTESTRLPESSDPT